MSDDQENIDQENVDQGAMADEWAAALAEQDDDGGQPQEQVKKPELDQFESGAVPAGNEDANLDLILDIPVNIAMEIGRTKISIRNLLQLNQGSVVELDRLAGEPMDVLVNGTLVAHGEVVVVNEKFGIRLTDVVSPAERVKKLK
ncbi:flagellar motor switch protein FliN [Thiohalobacter thiocyanaticus]|uniref:Flagellar motor switch protein FliN n=1 Tax=Thiohalobacter thiocyanaticus TaxID=585455 RepID=A0A426QGM6_9GAMM|nr:flagellar motor switch protein FliN [Thiohalobacter thiocyanaticus]RRQ20905.1 flagellar motor switch protein FliN [Thiohalobacter thiocyanaticus]